MTVRLPRTLLFALYQTSVALGILLLPVALLLRQLGVSVPVHRILERSGDAYRQRAE